LPAQELASRIVAQLAAERDPRSQENRIESVDEELERRFLARPEAPILISLPGMGVLLGAEVFWWLLRDLCAFESAETGSLPTPPGWW
jgi:hypothetical protein